MRTESQLRHEKLYHIAASQAGYFTAAQALDVGFSRRSLSYYVKTGRFERVGSGLYRLALFPASENEDLFRAWLEVGRKGVISHDSALALYDLSDALPSEIHLTVPPTTSRRRQGMRLHTNHLTAGQTTRYMGLPVTTIPRTIADVIAGGLADELVIQAIRQALGRGMVTPQAIWSLGEERGGRASRLIRAAMQGVGE